jgi:dolichol-phosphate mannosyltransferase
MFAMENNGGIGGEQPFLKIASKGNPPPGDPRITLVIPAKNESASIGEVIARAKPYVDEILVVDGHSTDGTREVSKALGARVISDNGKGKGDGIRVGIREARGDILVFMDADESHAPEDIPKLVQPLIQGKADMVIGSRMTGGSDELHGDLSRFIRMTGSHILLLMINYRWNVRLTDCQNGFRAIKTAVARKIGLREDIHTIEEEMVMKCLKKGFVVSEAPCHEYARKHGTSTLNLKSTWLKFVWCILKNYF